MKFDMRLFFENLHLLRSSVTMPTEPDAGKVGSFISTTDEIQRRISKGQENIVIPSPLEQATSLQSLVATRELHQLLKAEVLIAFQLFLLLR